MRTLAIDAWGNQDEGYDWNAWYDMKENYTGDIEDDKAMQEHLLQFIRIEFQDSVYFEDDGYNYILCVSDTGEPIYAIEYGAEL